MKPSGQVVLTTPRERDTRAGRTATWLKGSVEEQPRVMEGVRRSRVPHEAVGPALSSWELYVCLGDEQVVVSGKDVVLLQPSERRSRETTRCQCLTGWI